ncbi:DUF4261 domain-containing protein [Massilia sp.]|uniref:DUF4261 domain-containing protein n=1 Tax=Massilia sp. TaxID=1882437 RepID=UPI00289E57AA|nr:DUF4261 domain-containing protein [Massilia sp.]
MSTTPELVLCIPGPWENLGVLADEIAASAIGYSLAGGVLSDSATGFACELALQPADPNLVEDFVKAGPHWARSEAMADIDTHASVAYLVGPGGSRAAADAMMRAGAALIDSGGLGVKVDSTGIAHAPAYWIDMCEQLDQLTAHRALVVYVAGADVYSCGMHNFGLPEAVTSARDKTQAADMLRFFTRYLLERAPDLADGHTFSVSEGKPVYRLERVAAIDYGEASLFNNPYGAWRLHPPAPEKKGNWWTRNRQ